MYRFIVVLIFIFHFSSGQERSYPRIDSALSHIYTNSINSFNFKKGISETKKLIKKSEQLNYQKGVGQGYLNIANFLTNSGKYKESLNYLEIADKNANETQDYSLRAGIYLEYGKVYGYLDLLETSIDYFDKAIVANKRNNNKKLYKTNLQLAYASKAESFKFLSHYDSLYTYLKKAYQVIPEPIIAAEIADYFTKYKKDQIDSADYYLKTATEILQKKTYDALQKLIVLMDYGYYYIEKQEYENALNKFMEAAKLSREIKDVSMEMEIYQAISKIYSELKDKEKSTEFLQKYTVLSDSLKAANSMALNLSVDKLIKDKESEKEKEKSELKNRSYYIVGIISFIAIGLMIGGYFFHIRKKKEKELLIRIQKEEITKKEIEKMSLEHKVNNAFEEVVKLARNNDPSFLARFKEVYPEFCKTILTFYPDILNSELIFCAYLKLNFSTKEIANYTFVTEKAVQARKSRIRKKFNISSSEDLYIWFNKI